MTGVLLSRRRDSREARAEGRPREGTARRCRLQAQGRGLRRKCPAGTLSLTFRLRNCEIIHLWCLSCPVCGALLWQPSQSNTAGFSAKESTYSAGDARHEGLISESGRFPGGGNGNQLQYSCLENSIDRGALWAAVHGVTKSQTQLND